MRSSGFRLLSLKARLAGLVFGLVCSLSSLAAVVMVFASASGKLERGMAKLEAAPAASEVARMPAKPVRG